MDAYGQQRAQRQLIQIDTCFLGKVEHGLTGFPQQLQQLRTGEGEDLSELQDRKRGIGAREVLIVVVHQNDAEREEFVEDDLPLGVFQKRRKREHGMDGRLLLLELGAATRAEGELSRDVQMDQQDGCDVERRRGERVVRCLPNEFLRQKRTRHSPGTLGDNGHSCTPGCSAKAVRSCADPSSGSRSGTPHPSMPYQPLRASLSPETPPCIAPATAPHLKNPLCAWTLRRSPATAGTSC